MNPVANWIPQTMVLENPPPYGHLSGGDRNCHPQFCRYCHSLQILILGFINDSFSFIYSSHSQKAQADSLYDMPEHLKHFQSEASQRSEDMLSNQMLSGIPEIDLGIE